MISNKTQTLSAPSAPPLLTCPRVQSAEEIHSFQNRDGKALTVPELKKYAASAGKVVQSLGRHLKFRVREEVGALQIEVLERKGMEEKLIRKIPPDRVINFIEHIRDLLGALMDQEA